MTLPRSSSVPDGEKSLNRILIRGASGFLGRHLSRRLVARGEAARLHVRRTGRLPADLAANPLVEILEGDVQDERVVRESLKGVTHVIDFIGTTLPASPNANFLSELDLTLRPLGLLLDAMEEAAVPRLVFPSSGGTVYGRTEGPAVTEDAPVRPESYYGLGKALAEEMIRFRARRPGFEYLILRIANPFGREASTTPRQGAVDAFLRCALTGSAADIWGDGSQRRDYIFIDDVVRAIETLVSSNAWNETFHVGTGVGSSLVDVLRTVEEVTGKRLQQRRRGDIYAGVPSNVLDPARLRAATGWSPSYDLRSGIAEAWKRLTRRETTP
jgi:UDP-glucose 4-epimerase